MLPKIKVYEIDYDFMIKNYTSPELWDKVWTLFVYKNYVFTLTMDSIDVKRKMITFEVKLSSDLPIWSRNQSTTFKYAVDSMNLKMLKNEINSVMYRLIVTLETAYIEDKDETYKIANESRWDERQRLEEIANEFLDENGVSNKEIREVYIDHYVDENEQVWKYLSDIKTQKKYTYLVDLYLIYTELTENKELQEDIIQKQTTDISALRLEIEELMEHMETEEYVEEMKDNLEGI